MKIVECPRDAMQGWAHFIPTDRKIAYLNQLLKVGFDVLDFGSFVSPKAIPQMADTKDVIKELEIPADSKTKLLAIIANSRGAQDAQQYDKISYLGFPFSISETFQLRNTNKTIEASLEEVKTIHQIATEAQKEAVIYISMGFGNPYQDAYSPDIAIDWFKKLTDLGIKNIALADTIGVANEAVIQEVFNAVIGNDYFKDVNIGAHFHSTAANWDEKIDAAYKCGVRSFDTALKGIGGCPMAQDDLVGNIATENVVYYAEKNQIPLHIDKAEFDKSMMMANNIFI